MTRAWTRNSRQREYGSWSTNGVGCFPTTKRPAKWLSRARLLASVLLTPPPAEPPAARFHPYFSDYFTGMSDPSRTPVIVAAARTPIGKFLGGLSPLSAMEL